MRKFVLFAVLLTAFFIWLNRNDETTHGKAVAPAPTLSPSPRETSQHDWAKHSIEQTQAVIDQVQKDRAQAGQP